MRVAWFFSSVEWLLGYSLDAPMYTVGSPGDLITWRCIEPISWRRPKCRSTKIRERVTTNALFMPQQSAKFSMRQAKRFILSTPNAHTDVLQPIPMVRAPTQRGSRPATSGLSVSSSRFHSKMLQHLCCGYQSHVSAEECI